MVALSGMGEAAARRGGQDLVARCRPDLLVSLGFGGALTPGLAAGDLVLGESFWHYNPDTRELKAGPPPAAPGPCRCSGRPEEGGAHRGHRQSGHHPLSSTRDVRESPGLCRSRFWTWRPPPWPGWRRSGSGLSGAPGHYRRSRGRDSGVSPYCRDRGRRGGWGGPQVAGGRFPAAEDLLFLWRRSRLAARQLARALTVLLPLLLAPGGSLRASQLRKGR